MQTFNSLRSTQTLTASENPFTTTSTVNLVPTNTEGHQKKFVTTSTVELIRINTERHQGEDGHIKHPYMTIWTATVGLLVAFAGLMFGYDTGQISGFIAMSAFKKHFGKLDVTTGTFGFEGMQSGLLVGMVSVGGLCGSLCAAPLAERLGRRISISICSLVYIFGVVLQLSTSSSFNQLVAGRWVGGFGIGSLSILAPLYLTETAPSHVRGMVVTFYQLYTTLGILLANVINWATESLESTASWRITLGLCLLWAVVLNIAMIFFPESPRYDFRHGQVARARNTMASMLGTSTSHPIIVRELSEMAQKLAEEDMASDSTHRSSSAGSRAVYRALLGVSIMSFQQLTGINYFLYYGTSMFQKVGLSNPFVIQIILGAVNVACTFPGLWFAATMSRRKVLICGGLWMAICFVVFSSIGHFRLDTGAPSQTAGAVGVMIAFACLFIASFASTWGPLSWGESAALYPPRYRALFGSIATCANWTCNFLLAFFSPSITATIGYRYGFVFATTCLLMSGIVYFFLLESRGKSLEELDSMYMASSNANSNRALSSIPPASSTISRPQMMLKRSRSDYSGRQPEIVETFELKGMKSVSNDHLKVTVTEIEESSGAELRKRNSVVM